MGFWKRVRAGLRLIFFAEPPAKPKPPARRRRQPAKPVPVEPSPPGVDERRRRRRESDRLRRQRRRAVTAGIITLGRPSPAAAALYPLQIELLFASALEIWPNERWFTVAAFARYAIEDPGDGERYHRSLRQAYGRDVPITKGRHYYGWRAESMSRRQLEEFAPKIMPGILEAFSGRRPVRCVSVRPVNPA